MEKYSLYCHSCIIYMYIKEGWENQYWGEVKGGICFKKKKYQQTKSSLTVPNMSP